MARIDENTLNSAIEFCINEYVRLYRDREILREKWFAGLSFQEIAARHNLSETYVKDIVYKTGDKILFRAHERTKTLDK